MFLVLTWVIDHGNIIIRSGGQTPGIAQETDMTENNLPQTHATFYNGCEINEVDDPSVYGPPVTYVTDPEGFIEIFDTRQKAMAWAAGNGEAILA